MWAKIDLKQTPCNLKDLQGSVLIGREELQGSVFIGREQLQGSVFIGRREQEEGSMKWKSRLVSFRKCYVSVPSVISDSTTLWILTCKALLPMEFSRQEYWRGLPCPPPGDLPDPGIESVSCVSCIAEGFFTTEPRGSPLGNVRAL